MPESMASCKAAGKKGFKISRRRPGTINRSRLKLETGIFPPGLLGYFFVQLAHFFTQIGEDYATGFGKPVIDAAARGAVRVFLGDQPAVLFHAAQQRVERAGLYLVTMPAQFVYYPLAVDRFFGGVVEYMHFPEGKGSFTENEVIFHM